jgi:ubiquinone/menaquinone biosynthesis C-methylase UbiE
MISEATAGRGVNPFNALADSYDRMRAIPQPAIERIADEVVRCTGATVHTRIFEPGVGTGRIAAPFVRRGYDYTGLDSSAPMLDVLRSRPGGIRWRVVRGDARSLPFADASFDVALTAHLLYLIDDWPAALAEIRRVLRPAGVYLHCVENSSPTPAAQEIMDAWQEAVGAVGAGASWSWPAATTDADILVALREGKVEKVGKVGNADVESTVAASWSRHRSLGEFLDGYGTRLRPLYPAVPDETFASVTRNFLDSVRKAYPEGAVVGHDIHFEIHAVRWRPGSWPGPGPVLGPKPGMGPGHGRGCEPV